jgi:hypothetical protein
MPKPLSVLLLLIAGSALVAALPQPAGARASAPAVPCRAADPDPPPYYAIDLISTKKVPGSRQAAGIGAVTFAASPFGVSIASNGSYVYELAVGVDRLTLVRKGAYVAWVSTPSLDQVQRLGVLDENMQVKGTVTWNKFLVIITLEPSADDLGERWQGPVVLRGMSRSGMMHTMAGHGPFETEPCAVYGF